MSVPWAPFSITATSIYFKLGPGTIGWVSDCGNTFASRKWRESAAFPSKQETQFEDFIEADTNNRIAGKKTLCMKRRTWLDNQALQNKTA